MPWKAASGGAAKARTRDGSKSIRGQISGPIPISNPADDEFPIRDQAEDEFPEEFPMRQSAAYRPSTMERQSRIIDEYNSATRESAAVQQQDDSRFPVEAPDQFYNSSTDTDASSNRPVAASSAASRPGPPQRLPQSKSAPSAGRLRESMATMTSGKAGQSDDTPKRKKSTLRSAFGRLFGRKKKRESKDSTALAVDRSTAPAVRVTDSVAVVPNQQHTSVS